jgi:hypothetical protein
MRGTHRVGLVRCRWQYATSGGPTYRLCWRLPQRMCVGCTIDTVDPLLLKTHWSPRPSGRGPSWYPPGWGPWPSITYYISFPIVLLSHLDVIGVSCTSDLSDACAGSLRDFHRVCWWVLVRYCTYCKYPFPLEDIQGSIINNLLIEILVIYQ